MDKKQITAWLQDLLFELDGGSLYPNPATRAHLDAVDAAIEQLQDGALITVAKASIDKGCAGCQYQSACTPGREYC